MSAELHNRVVRSALHAIFDPMAAAGARDDAIMVVIESVVLGVLLTNELVHGCSRRYSTEALETMVNNVLERLAKHDVQQ